MVGDNIDYEIRARVQSQKHKNRSIHWTRQFAVLDRAQDPTLDCQINILLNILASYWTAT